MSEASIDGALSILSAPRGAGPGPDAARDAALAMLLADPDMAHPRLLALAEGIHPPPLILLALAVFGRPESIPVLTTALRNGDAPTAVIAADALARHRLPAARAALEAALRGTSKQATVAAADALASRGDRTALPALRDALTGVFDEEIRHRIAAAITALERR